LVTILGIIQNLKQKTQEKYWDWFGLVLLKAFFSIDVKIWKKIFLKKIWISKSFESKK